jgi:hypothetical protein
VPRFPVSVLFFSLFFLLLLLLVINGITGVAGVGRVPTAMRVICTLLISVHFSVLYLFEIVGLYFVGVQKALFMLLWRCFLMLKIVF